MRAVRLHEFGPALVTTYPLADAARAHAGLESRRALGKVVLLPGDGGR
ncbi:MAG TPA: zinc-binding dehydrogenase [Nocardioides sp.]|nr:zinc-binding dehydrogenase [Nocardioides sp.]